MTIPEYSPYLADPRGLAAAWRVAGDGRTAPDHLASACHAVLAAAQAALSAGPWSVTSKSTLAPSGDPHDYCSIGPYWWPDPAKADGLPWLRRDGEVNPLSRNGDNLQMSAMAEAVSTLALAWWLTGEARYADRAMLVLRHWFIAPATRMNPHLRYGQAVPGRCDGRGIGIIDTTRLRDLPDAVALLEGVPGAAELRGELQGWFGEYLDWLQTSEIGLDEARQANNHGTWYDVQVALFARFAGRPEAARVVLAAFRERRLLPQLAADGSQPHELSRTLSQSYSLMNLEAYTLAARLAEPLGLDLWRGRQPPGPGIRAACDYLVPFLLGDTPWTHPQIKPLEGAAGARALRLAALRYDEHRLDEAWVRHAGPEAAASSRVHLLHPPVTPSKPTPRFHCR